nr:unnamed protein product [Digitaria exilis]
MAGKSPLRRWKPFFPAFGIIDAAIEASVVPALSRDKVRSARDEVVEMLRGVPAADARDSEEFCVLLDGFMAESLLTLRAVPAEAVPRVLASSADLAKAVGALRRHESDRIRGLARDVIRGWTVAVEEDIARTSAAMKRLDDVCRQTTKAAAEASHPKTTNKTAPVTKRKLHQRYQEVEDAKRQRKIQEIQAPKMPEQRQRNIVHPILRERSQARSGKSTVVRRCAVSSS